MATHKALVLHEWGKQPVYQDFPKPELKDGQFLIKVQGSTVNPSDKAMLTGAYGKSPLPAVVGLEGTGTVVEAKGQNVQAWIGKRVSFIKTGSGSWGQFSVSDPNKSFEIEKDVPLVSAASGVVNPLTVIAMTHMFENNASKKGLIHTAAASALGRMLNKRCQTLGIPLLNIVRREEQAEILKKEGAKHVIITKGDWQEEYKAAIKEHGFNIMFDALGGGEVSEALIEGLGPKSWVYVYGVLSGQPLVIKQAISLCKGVNITGFMLFLWYGPLPEEEKNKIRSEYSKWLKGDLSTQSYKTLTFANLSEALELSVSKATEGKVTLIPC